MAKDKLTDYDSTASGNLDVGGISVAEGMLPSGVNNAIRELMSHQADAFGAGTPLYVDQTNNRLGIGNAAPATALTVDADGATVATFDRATSDGTIIDVQKDGSTVGSIGTISGGTYIGSGDTGLFFEPVTNQIRPFNTSTVSSIDATIDLGRSTNRFKDLYLSGGVYLGGTGSANYLDDYEEGDYDCFVTPITSGSVTLDNSFNRASYTKVGRLVTVNGFLVVSSVSSPVGYFTINLPFVTASLTDRAGDSVASLIIQNVNSTNISNFVGATNEGSSTLFVQLGDALQVQSDSAQELIANTYITFSITYPTA